MSDSGTCDVSHSATLHVSHSSTLQVSHRLHVSQSSAIGALPASDFGAENVWAQGNAEQTPQSLMLELPVQLQLDRHLLHLERMEHQSSRTLQSSRTSIPPDGSNPQETEEYLRHVRMEQMMLPASMHVRAPPVPQEPPQPDQFQHNPFQLSPSEEQQQEEAAQRQLQQLIHQQRQQARALIEQQERDHFSMLTMQQQQVS